jgi:multidrug resistance efflux pump
VLISIRFLVHACTNKPCTNSRIPILLGIGGFGYTQADRDKAHADSDKAQADRDKAQADRDKAHADSDKAQADRDKAQADRKNDRLLANARHYNFRAMQRNNKCQTANAELTPLKVEG